MNSNFTQINGFDATPVRRNDAVSLHDLLLADRRLVRIATFRARNLVALPFRERFEAAVEKYFSSFWKVKFYNLTLS